MAIIDNVLIIEYYDIQYAPERTNKPKCSEWLKLKNYLLHFVMEDPVHVLRNVPITIVGFFCG